MKQTITGHGGADKDQMERMVQTLLGIATPLRPVDAADAVAVALCHLAHAPLRERSALVPPRRPPAMGSAELSPRRWVPDPGPMTSGSVRGNP